MTGDGGVQQVADTAAVAARPGMRRGKELAGHLGDIVCEGDAALGGLPEGVAAAVAGLDQRVRFVDEQHPANTRRYVPNHWHTVGRIPPNTVEIHPHR